MEFIKKLKERSLSGNDISVGIIGCGQMGSGLAHSVKLVEGMKVGAIADIAPERAIKVYTDMGYDPGDIIITEKEAVAADAVRTGKPLITSDATMLAGLEGIDINVEATGVTEIGSLFAWSSISAGKPVVMLNVETDVTVGHILNHLSRKSGSLYTVASGDEPGVLKMLYEQAVLMGLEVSALGKGQVNKIDYSANPETTLEEATARGINPRILAEFKDGTKTAVEMCAVSNATGLAPDIPGMHGPAVDISDLNRYYIPKADGGILSGRGRVDYSTGNVAPGVFAVVYTDDPDIRTQMKYHMNSDWPYYTQLRPYHLCNIETPQSIAEAVLFSERTVVSEHAVSDVVCVAKRDLAPGNVLEGIGGHDVRGMVIRHDDAVSQRAVPIGIAANGVITKPVKAGEILTFDAVTLKQDTFVHKLWTMQNDLLGRGLL